MLTEHGEWNADRFVPAPSRTCCRCCAARCRPLPRRSAELGERAAHGGAASGATQVETAVDPARARRVLPILRAPWLRPAAGTLALLLSAYGIWQGMAVPKPRQIEVAIDGLPAAFDGYRVLQLTDIHASRLLTGAWVEKVVAESNALHPDLVVITGDLIDGTVSARANDFAPLARLQAPDGVITITGNH
jgi:hypothetical protein